MTKAKTWLALVVATLFCCAVLAPAAMAWRPFTPYVTLKGPSNVKAGSTFTIKGQVGNCRGEVMTVKIVKKIDNKWLTVQKVKVRWGEDDLGRFSAKVKAVGPAMGLIKFKARYVEDGKIGVSDACIVEVD
jgi:hypothetical protein